MSWNSEQKEEQRHHTLQRGRFAQNSHVARVTQQISSVFTEQSQAGVKNSVSERFVTKENEQLLKNVKPQEVNSLVQTPRSDNPASGNRLRESLQNFETLEKSIQCTKVCEDASFWKRVSVGMCCKTIADVDDGFWKSNSSMQRVYTPSCRFRFHNFCRNPRTNYNWTSYSSSYYTVSWHSWN